MYPLGLVTLGGEAGPLAAEPSGLRPPTPSHTGGLRPPSSTDLPGPSAIGTFYVSPQ